MDGVVARWTGLEARALRVAKRMSVREFASRLGLNTNSVSTWEKRGTLAHLRFETQQLLDTVFAQLDEDGQRRFHLIITKSGTHTPEDNPDDPTSSADASATPNNGVASQDLGGRSVQRTTVIAAAMHTTMESLPFLAPEGAIERMRRFERSIARVFVVKGPPGCGKTTTVSHLASELAAEMDCQFHSVDSWRLGQLDLAVHILRYASIPGGEDPLLTLERLASQLDRTLLIVIVGIGSREQLHEVGRQLDTVLRQVGHPRLRFALVARTPPELELTMHPVLAASIYEPDQGDRGVSLRLTPWRHEQARLVWEAVAEPGQTPFMDLPSPVQRLATVPLYMTLLRAAGQAGADRPATAFRLVDQCVQTLLRRASADTVATISSISDLAVRDSEILAPPSLPLWTHPRDLPRENPGAGIAPLVVGSPDGTRFTHDVIREYFIAIRFADLLVEQGRSVASVSAINDLAEQAMTSAAARGVLEFVACRIDERDPQLASAITLSPTLSVDTALPLLLRAPTTAAASAPVLQSCATRAVQSGTLDLTRALLSGTHVATALGEAYPEWIITVLRRFGPRVWADMLIHLEQSLDADMAADLLAAADFERGDEATFFARNAQLFHGISSSDWLRSLVSHADWRVRAALAEGLLGTPSRDQQFALPIIERLVSDDDYKVRAAVARSLAGAHRSFSPLLQALIADPNWHVRANLLRGLLRRVDESAGVGASVVHLRVAEEEWRDAPAEAALLRQRMLLLTGENEFEDTAARRRALFGLLREVRTGWTPLPEQTLERVALEGGRSPSWLVRREAEAIKPGRNSGMSVAGPANGMARREAFRRLRGRRSVQIALDLHDLDHAVGVAEALAAVGVDFIEVGDPLIKQVGVRAIERVKQAAGATWVVAEMMSADWGRDQVEQAAEAGADIVLLIGPATTASVSAAVEAGRRLGTPILLDVPSLHGSQHWVREMERAGIDGFTITSNIDIGVGVGHPLARSRAVRSWSELPVAVSGGFSSTDLPILASSDWDVLIVGRSVTEAIRPGAAAEQLLNLVHAQGKG